MPTKLPILVKHSGKTPITTSRIIAKAFGREHKTVLAALETLEENLGKDVFSRLKILPSNYVFRGKEYPEFLLDQKAFMVFAMGFTGAEAARLRLAFVEAFEAAVNRLAKLERQLPEWIDARKSVADNSRLLNDILKSVRTSQGKETTVWHYANEAALITFALTGKSKPPVDRQSLDYAQLKLLAAIENEDIRLLVAGHNYAARKEALRIFAGNAIAASQPANVLPFKESA